MSCPLEVVRDHRNRRIYPWEYLQDGDWFTVRPGTSECVHCLQRKVGRAIAGWRSKHGGKYTTTMVDGGVKVICCVAAATPRRYRVD